MHSPHNFSTGVLSCKPPNRHPLLEPGGHCCKVVCPSSQAKPGMASAFTPGSPPNPPPALKARMRQIAFSVVDAFPSAPATHSYAPLEPARGSVRPLPGAPATIAIARIYPPHCSFGASRKHAAKARPQHRRAPPIAATTTTRGSCSAATLQQRGRLAKAGRRAPRHLSRKP